MYHACCTFYRNLPPPCQRGRHPRQIPQGRAGTARARGPDRHRRRLRAPALCLRRRPPLPCPHLQALLRLRRGHAALHHAAQIRLSIPSRRHPYPQRVRHRAVGDDDRQGAARRARLHAAHDVRRVHLLYRAPATRTGRDEIFPPVYQAVREAGAGGHRALQKMRGILPQGGRL